MRLLKLVEMVPGQVGVVKTTSTIMSHTRSHNCRLLHRSLQRYSSHSFLEVSAMLSSHRKTWKIFYVPLPTMCNVVTTKVVAMG
jgi:hypothetical protein